VDEKEMTKRISFPLQGRGEADVAEWIRLPIFTIRVNE
jgi:hypothetical protein